MKLSDYLVNYLRTIGIDCIFGYPGGAVTHIIDSIYHISGIHFIGMATEQGAAFAAEGYARSKDDLGVALATSGPGATNLITGIGSAYFDSVPVLYITGQVNTYEFKKSYKETKNIRQLGFQETDIIEIVKPIVKYAKQITNPNEIKFELQKAIHIAKSGRPGPVLLDIPMDIQRADVNSSSLISYTPLKHTPDLSNVSKAVDMIRASKRPVILIGGGCRLKDTHHLERFLKETQIPVVASLMGLERINFKYENFLGLMGVYGSRYANYTVANSDLILSIGSRLDNRQTAKRDTFAKKAKLIRIDIDDTEFEYKVKPDELNLHISAQDFIDAIKNQIKIFDKVDEAWIAQIKKWKKAYPFESDDEKALPNKILKKLGKLIPTDAILSVDVGQNQIWAAQSINTSRLHKFMVCGGMGAMGFSLPSAIGAYFANKENTIISINGDGGLQMNIQEFQTIKRYKLPVKVIVFNNQALGMIRHFQEMYFNNIYAGTIFGYDAPDFTKVAEGYGLKGYAFNEDSFGDDMKKLLSRKGSSVIEIRLPQNTYIFPKLSMGHPIEDQDPLLPRTEFENNMNI
jgi:acetolactate synthase-1/2/3 large subunit